MRTPFMAFFQLFGKWWKGKGKGKGGGRWGGGDGKEGSLEPGEYK